MTQILFSESFLGSCFAVSWPTISLIGRFRQNGQCLANAVYRSNYLSVCISCTCSIYSPICIHLYNRSSHTPIFGTQSSLFNTSIYHCRDLKTHSLSLTYLYYLYSHFMSLYLPLFLSLPLKLQHYRFYHTLSLSTSFTHTNIHYIVFHHLFLFISQR